MIRLDDAYYGCQGLIMLHAPNGAPGETREGQCSSQTSWSVIPLRRILVPEQTPATRAFSQSFDIATVAIMYRCRFTDVNERSHHANVLWRSSKWTSRRLVPSQPHS